MERPKSFGCEYPESLMSRIDLMHRSHSGSAMVGTPPRPYVIVSVVRR